MPADKAAGPDVLAVLLILLALCALTALGVWTLIVSSYGEAARELLAGLLGAILGASAHRLYGKPREAT